MMIKRSTREGEFEDITSMANCLMVLSARGGAEESNRRFECTTCNRQFTSFQALGGHRASHKKPRLTIGSDQLSSNSSPPKPKTHECSICGLEFSIGQALGGHMRRHKAAINDQKQQHMPILSLSLSHAPVVKKSNSRWVLCPDLNLTPSENNFIFGKINAPIHCFL